MDLCTFQTEINLNGVTITPDVPKILEGLMTVVASIIALFGMLSFLDNSAAYACLLCLVMVDFPATSRFLTPEERAYVIWRKSAPRFPSSCPELILSKCPRI